MEDIIMENQISQEQAIEALAQLHNACYDEYFFLSNLAADLIHNGEKAAYKAISRRAAYKSYFLDGVKASAEALGIDPQDFRQAINVIS